MPDGIDLTEMAVVLTEWLSPATGVQEEDRRHAAEALEAMGLPGVVQELQLVRRILRFGNSFHTIARFFADGSPEQRYLLELVDESGSAARPAATPIASDRAPLSDPR